MNSRKTGALDSKGACVLRCLIAWIYELIKQEEKTDSLAVHKEVLSTSVAPEPSCCGAWTRS